MFDILSYVLKSYTEDKTTLDGTQLHVWCQNISKLSVKGEEFAHHTIRDLIGMLYLIPVPILERNLQIEPILHCSEKRPSSSTYLFVHKRST